MVDVSFAEFSWELKKHFFVEENAIFDFIPMKTFGVFETISHLKDEHLTMLVNLKKFSDNLQEIRQEDIDNFGEMLQHHREEEEKELYPKLDNELGDEQKSQIMARINEIPVTKSK
jgi:hemerythrin superfamily protein